MLETDAEAMMSKPSLPGEFELIARYFAPLARAFHEPSADLRENRRPAREPVRMRPGWVHRAAAAEVGGGCS